MLYLIFLLTVGQYLITQDIGISPHIGDRIGVGWNVVEDDVTIKRDLCFYYKSININMGAYDYYGGDNIKDNGYTGKVFLSIPFINILIDSIRYDESGDGWEWQLRTKIEGGISMAPNIKIYGGIEDPVSVEVTNTNFNRFINNPTFTGIIRFSVGRVEFLPYLRVSVKFADSSRWWLLPGNVIAKTCFVPGVVVILSHISLMVSADRVGMGISIGDNTVEMPIMVTYGDSYLHVNASLLWSLE